MALLIAGKFLGAAWAWVVGLRNGEITWRFPAALVAGWLLAAALLILVLPTWRTGGLYPSLLLAAILPLARLAWSPVALAANRHR